MTEWVRKGRFSKVADLEIRGKIVPSTIVQILQNRGYSSPEKIEEFFAPSLSHLHNPFLLNDMDKASERIVQAVHNREKILVHGDYDADGITSTALLMRHLNKLGADVEYHVPHRLVDGYGLSRSGINLAIKNNSSLIIAVDCGITAMDEILYANQHNIDVIVCDHHKPKETLPQAYALLNPKIAEDNYPFKDLAGVGVAFKLLQALYEKLNLPKEEIYEDLDLVALGSVVDVVPLINENRTMVKYGIKKFAASKKIGLKALLEEVGLKGGLTSYHLAFVIGPRINACGRLQDAKVALKLFLTQDKSQAKQLAKTLSLENQKRQKIEDSIYQDAQVLIEKDNLDKDRVILLGKENWHEGVIGIVASRISETFHRPTILLTMKKENARGSARSIMGFDITDALKSCSSLLTKYGGHSQAAGLELKSEDITQLKENLNEYAKQQDENLFTKKSFYDFELDLDKITAEIVYYLGFFEPTGTANPQPVFLGENFEVVGVPRVIGSAHLKFAVRKKTKVFEAIAYGKAENILDIEVGKTHIDCLYYISEDSFLGKKKVVLKIKEMKKRTD
jgi:single-stranded-DNA-specific exonuclease